MNILDRIITHKREVVAERKRVSPDPIATAQQRTPRPFGAVLRKKNRISVIAEFKKASPSKGVIRDDVVPVDVAHIYETNGASAMSVLTDEKFFHGHADFLSAIHDRIALPVLRKDFMIDPYQIHEAYAMGADAILLIVSVLTDDELVQFQQIARDFGMASLVEVHHEDELTRALDTEARIVGINNRDLTDFSVDLNTSLTLKTRIPEDVITISESGIYGYKDVETLRNAGFDAILVGESLMRSEDIGAKLRELTGAS